MNWYIVQYTYTTTVRCFRRSSRTRTAGRSRSMSNLTPAQAEVCRPLFRRECLSGADTDGNGFFQTVSADPEQDTEYRCPDLQKRHEKEQEKDQMEFATVQVPSVLPQISPICRTARMARQCVILAGRRSSSAILPDCFSSYDVVCAHPYRIMRNADPSD